MKPRHIVVSIVVAVSGLAAVFVAQPWPGQRSQPDPAPVAAPQGPMRTIVVAVRPLRFGTEIKPEHLKQVEWAESAVPSGAYASVLDIKGRTVLSPIEVNEPVLSWKMTGSGERATLSTVVDDGMRAMSVSISDLHGVTGFVLPGDRVDVVLTRNGYADILLQDIKVLAIDHVADERPAQPKSGKTATLEVNTIDAQALMLAQSAGTLSLALRAAGSVDAATPRRIRMKDLGPAFEFYSEAQDGEGQEEPAVDLLEEYQRRENPVLRFRGTPPTDTDAVPFDPDARVGVIRGMNRREYEVPKLNADESEEKTAVELLTMKMEEIFQAIMEFLWDAPGWSNASQASASSGFQPSEPISPMSQEFRRTQAMDTDAVPFDPEARVGVLRGLSRQKYEVPHLESRSLSFKCAGVTPRHPFAGRHPCFPE